MNKANAVYTQKISGYFIYLHNIQLDIRHQQASPICPCPLAGAEPVPRFTLILRFCLYGSPQGGKSFCFPSVAQCKVVFGITRHSQDMTEPSKTSLCFFCVEMLLHLQTQCRFLLVNLFGQKIERIFLRPLSWIVSMFCVLLYFILQYSNAKRMPDLPLLLNNFRLVFMLKFCEFPDRLKSVIGCNRVYSIFNFILTDFLLLF